MQNRASGLRRINLPRTWVHSPQPKPRFGGYSQRPEVFSEKFSFLLSLLRAGPFTRKEASPSVADADRIVREVCGGALVATIHHGITSKGDADVTTTVTGAATFTCAFRAARSTYWVTQATLGVVNEPLRTDIGHAAGAAGAAAIADRGASRALLALPAHADRPRPASVAAGAAVGGGTQIGAGAAAILGPIRARTACLIFTCTNARAYSCRAALATTLYSWTRAASSPGRSWDGGQRSPYQGSTHQPERLTSR
jgi:hypothetical protein